MPYEKWDSFPEIIEKDIKFAHEAGIDGFALDAFNEKQARNILQAFTAAIERTKVQKFHVALSADMSLGFAPSGIVQVMKEFGHNPHYLVVEGKPLLTTYGGADRGDNWWKENVLEPLAGSGNGVTFIPYFDRRDPNGDPVDVAAWTEVLNRFPSVNGLFNFLLPKSVPFRTGDQNLGHHSWSTIEAQESLSAALGQKGLLFMSSYMPYYWAVCHPVRQYHEYLGGIGMKSAWESIIERQKPDLVELVTWNDYSESTYLQPTDIPSTKFSGIQSYSHAGFLQLLSYYIYWYKSGHQPEIGEDAVFAFFRPTIPDNDVRFTSACPLGPVPDRQKWGLPRPSLFVTVASRAPAILTINMGSNTYTVRVPAGISNSEFPLAPGFPTLILKGQGKPDVRVTSEVKVAVGGEENFNLASISSRAKNSPPWFRVD